MRAPDFDFPTLQTPEGLADLTARFESHLEAADPVLRARLDLYAAREDAFTRIEESELIIAAAPHLEDFLAALFGVREELDALAADIEREQVVSRFKKEVVQKHARRYRGEAAESFDDLERWVIEAAGVEHGADVELRVARFAVALASDESRGEEFERLVAWCALALERGAYPDWVSLRLPGNVDHAHLVPLHEIVNGDVACHQGRPGSFRQRSDFSLTDPRMNQREVQDEINYCVYCHDHGGDFCSIGFPEKKKQPELGLKKNPLGVVLTGCPLEEKISEMHVLKRQGRSIAALAVAMIDNPMIPATGHRICNDCMKACVYQKKTPVDIPQTETRILTDVLELPWGVEIYDLLCRWHPLRKTQRALKPYNGRKVLVVGLGPAGFTMAHHLTMEGCAVVGIDGLKIEPLPDELLKRPIRRFGDIGEGLDERVMHGFGGVAEYGITARWDKNFLKLIYLTLCRRRLLKVRGGVRLGGTLTIEDARALGFDHVCVATGAGLPKVIPIGNSLARGMRQASDFLMTLQLTGAAKDDSLASLQIRMPAVVIGGGLTAVDTATEAQVYYLKQVRKIHRRYNELVERYGESHVTGPLDDENRAILNEYLEHAHALLAEEENAAREGREPDYIGLVRSWGGVTIVYRRGINESPAYQRNHEELIKALEEGIYYAPGLDPDRIELDRYGHVEALVCHRMKSDKGRWLRCNEPVTLAARCVLVAAGTLPNTVYENEHPGSMTLEGDHFLPHVDHAHGVQPVQVAEHVKSPEYGPFTSYDENGFRVSFIGDTHPVFHGSVVKAIASAARCYADVLQAMDRLGPSTADESEALSFFAHVDDQLSCTVVSIRDDNPVVLEMWVRAPLAARNFHAGQFFRLQTFETLSPVARGTRLHIPLQTVSGAGVTGDMVRLMLLKWNPNAKLATLLKEGDPVVLMGPTGAPMDVDGGKTYLVISGTWGAAVMLGLGPALRAAGNRVIYVAAYGDRSQVYAKQELEASTDAIIWAVAHGEKIEPGRPQDCSVQCADVVRLLKDYAAGRLDADRSSRSPRRLRIPLTEVDELLIMGSTGLLKAVQTAFKGDLAALFDARVRVTGTVGSPMQCMMKGVCGQCLQWQINPYSGERTRAVFSCAAQDQPLMWIDLDNLAARQGQTRLQEHLTSLWVDHVLSSARA